MSVREIIATISVDRHDLSKSAFLYLVRASKWTYNVYLFSVKDVNGNQHFNVLFTKNRDDAVKAFKLAADILIEHGRDYLLEKLKSPEGLCIGES